MLTPAGLRAQWLAELSARFGLTALLADTAWLRSLVRRTAGGREPLVASRDLHRLARPREAARSPATARGRRVGCRRRRRGARRDVWHRSAHGHTRHRRAGAPRDAPHRDAPRRQPSRARCALPDRWPRKVTLTRSCSFSDRERTWAKAGRARRRCSPSFRPRPSAACTTCSLATAPASGRRPGRRGDERARLVSIVLRKRALSSAASLAASVERRLALLSMWRPDPWQLSLPLAAVADEDPLADEEPLAALAVPGLADPRLERRYLAAIAAGRAPCRERRAQDPVSAAAARAARRAGDRLHRVSRHPGASRGARRAAGHAVSVLHGGMTPAERSRVQHAFNHGGGTLARHRRRVGRPEPAPAVPRDRPLRAAVESIPARAARGTSRPTRADAPGSRAGARRRAHRRAPGRRPTHHPLRRNHDGTRPDARRADGVARGGGGDDQRGTLTRSRG